jgi:hypothetical protein
MQSCSGPPSCKIAFDLKTELPAGLRSIAEPYSGYITSDDNAKRTVYRNCEETAHNSQRLPEVGIVCQIEMVLVSRKA